MADTIEYEEGFDFGGNTSDDANPIVPFRQDSLNLVDIVEAQGLTYQYTITAIKALDLSYCPKYAYCFANDKLYEYVATSIATADDIDVLMPTSLVGRWVKIKDYSTSVGVTKSYVDLQDADTLQAANDYTDAYCEAGAEVNDITSISVNSVNVAPDGSRNVDITVPENTSDLNNDDNFVADANYVHTDNNYDNAAVNKLAGIATGAQVNVIEIVKVNNVALPIVEKAVNITTTKGDDGDSAYDVAVAEGFDGSQSEWVASLQGTNGTLWKYTAIALVVGSDVLVNDLIAPFNVDDLVISTNNNIWGIIKSVAGADAIVTGLGQGGANGNDGAAIFLGTAVTGTGTGISVVVAGSKAGDYYKNTATSFFYQATAADTWDYKGSDKGADGADGTVTFFGTDVEGTISGISATVVGSKAGDTYKNTDTSDYYIATAPNTWDYKGNDKGANGADANTILESWYNEVTTLEDTDYLPFFLADGTPSRITVANLKTVITI